jgi:MFS family permease
MKTPQRKGLAILYFLFGFAVISWVPRFPEVKQNLHLSNGQFGTLISAGAIGSMISLLTVGHLVHRYGTRRILSASATLLFAALSFIVHAYSSWQFLLANIALGAGVSAFSTALNGQALYEQAPIGENLIPRMQGMWSIGALSTAIISGFLTDKVSLALHIDVVAAIVYVIILILLHKFAASMLPGSQEANGEYSMQTLFSSFNIDWVMVIGVTCASMVEFSTGDWATIFAKQKLHMSAGVSTIPYILFVLAMIIGRLTVHRVTEHIAIEDLVRRGAMIGGAAFIVAIIIGIQVSKSSPTLGFAIVVFGMFIAGLGDSFLGPTFLDAANRRSRAPSSVVLGQLGVVQTLFVFMIRGIIAWTAQFASIAVAFMIPALMMIAVAFMANAIKKAHV